MPNQRIERIDLLILLKPLKKRMLLNFYKNKIMKKEEVFVDNIKCGGCSSSIKSALIKITGVANPEVNIDAGKVIFDCDSEETKAIVSKKIAGMVYAKKGTSTLVQKGKYYVSCVIGRGQG